MRLEAHSTEIIRGYKSDKLVDAKEEKEAQKGSLHKGNDLVTTYRRRP